MYPTLILLWLACGEKDPAADDTGPPGDGGSSDGGSSDGGSSDGGSSDGGSSDGGSSDGGSSDGGSSDGGGDTGEDCPEPLPWFYDADGDGYGDEGLQVSACEAPGGYVDAAGDCDDLDPEVHPLATELCGDGRDQDCTGGDAACPLPAGGELAAVAWSIDGLTPDKDAGHPIATGDFDGDGIGDLFLGDPRADGSQGGALLYLGPFAEDRALSEAALVVQFLDSQSDYPGLGAAVLVGDMDGDGLSDLVLSAPNRYDPISGSLGGAWWMPGPLAGDADPITLGHFLAPSGADVRIGQNAALGDLSGDGALDLVLSSSEDDMPLYVVAGPLSGAGSLPALGFRVEQSDLDRTPGKALAVRDDLDGDGLADLVIGNPNDDTGSVPGQVRLLRGPIDGDRIATDADTLITGDENGDRLGWALATGDLDEDGLADLVAGAPTSNQGAKFGGMIYGFLRPFDDAALPAELGELKLQGSAAGIFGGAALALDDLDGDGRPDLAYNTVGLSMDQGQAQLMLAPLVDGEALDEADRTWTHDAPGTLPGWWLSAERDLTGEGRNDLVIGVLDEAVGGAAWIPKTD